VGMMTDERPLLAVDLEDFGDGVLCLADLVLLDSLFTLLESGGFEEEGCGAPSAKNEEKIKIRNEHKCFS
jgi:hypothetical protein